MNKAPELSVMIPCLNESARLPLLLADLRRSELALEILLADGGSSDATAQIAGLVGAHLIGVHPAGRGRQLRAAAARARGDWLLFLHADSRLPQQWSAWLTTLLQGSSADASAWYFDLRISPSTPARRLLERAVGLRSRWLQRPYGDQGLLLHRGLYERCGGFAELPLMEDLELVERLSRIAELRRIGLPLTTDGRRWQQDGVLRRSWRNARLRRRWRQGESAAQLAKAYYGP
jgi:rSAM/selenodomain-associated transferase 2